jgi:rhodanese-related sulfurtransferase
METKVIPAVVSPGELEELLRARPDVRLLDVRTPGEYEAAHIAGAYNVPLDTLGEHAADIRAHVDEPVVLVCQSGARARRAEEALKAAGLPQLHVLDGGVSGWVAAGKPVRRGAARISLERQVRIAAGALAATGGFLALLVSPLFALLPAFVGSGLVFAGVTDTCAMGMLLAKLPYNRPASCDVDAMVRALKTGAAPAGPGRSSAAGTRAAPSCGA